MGQLVGRVQFSGTWRECIAKKIQSNRAIDKSINKKSTEVSINSCIGAYIYLCVDGQKQNRYPLTYFYNLT